MKKIYKNILLASAAMLSLTVKSQVSTYFFTQTQGSYASVSGGTVLGNTSSDDQVFVDPSVPLGTTSGATGPGLVIGFTFTYNNTPYDRIGVNNNGWIFFGQSTLTPAVNSNVSSGYTGISGTSTAPAALQNHVAGLSRDLQAQTGSDLRVVTIGTTPSQTCVIQWSSYRKFGNTGDAIDFQIRLMETTNMIEVVYGNFVNNATAGTAEVGLRGSTNADFNNRNVAATSPWATSIAGTANNVSVNFNNTGLVPSSGQTYRWFPPVPCSGTPISNTVVPLQGLICPNGGAVLNLANTYTNIGLTYQWYSSTTSIVGPFQPVSGATLSTLSVPNQTISTWYQAAITCTVSVNTATASAGAVQIASTTIDNVPYYEGFENIVLNNQLPNCSWAASNPTNICQTYTIAQANNRIPHSGSKYGSFRYGTNSTGDYFYSSGIQLQAGITYSAAMWYITDGNIGWSNLSLMLGTAQTSTALTGIASVTGAVSGQFYQSLSNTFSVSSSGIYYLTVKCIGNNAPQYLTFDDLSITIPCSLNAPTLTIAAPANTVCAGKVLPLIASGSTSYTWSTGATTPTIGVSPSTNTVINVSGTNTLTGCIGTSSINVVVIPSPNVVLFTPQSYVCAGSTTTLYGFGAPNLAWSTGGFGPSIVVSPTAPTSYSLIGTASNGCSGSATATVGVKSLPTVFAQTSNSGTMCVGESVTLIASGPGLVTYTWSSNNTYITVQNAVVSPIVSTTYTLTATDGNGCSASSSVTQPVSPCTGITSYAGAAGLSVYPNPTSGNVTIETGERSDKTITVTDITGRVVLITTSSSEKVELNLEGLAKGVYYAKVSSAGQAKAVKIVKE